MASELGVQTLQHTNGTDAMTIDSTGRVLTQQRPAFHAWQTGWTRPAVSTLHITFDTLNLILAIIMIQALNGLFTVPVNGVYLFLLTLTTVATRKHFWKWTN